MTERITNKHLEHLVDLINQATNSPMTPYTTGEGANIGNYHIAGAYGGVALHRMSNKGGGIRVIFGGYTPKRELYNKMQAFLSGIGAAND